MLKKNLKNFRLLHFVRLLGHWTASLECADVGPVALDTSALYNLSHLALASLHLISSWETRVKFEKVEAKKIETGRENREKMATRKISASRKSSRCSSVDRSMENIPEEADEKPFRHFINKQVDQCVLWSVDNVDNVDYNVYIGSKLIFYNLLSYFGQFFAKHLAKTWEKC